jgi:mitochondrial enoyl-[acyl-carrier protein] reductase / trans-2-enoyl-CoA reductase
MSSPIRQLRRQAPGQLSLVQADLADPAPGEVQIELCASPINPADLNLIEGRYPIAHSPESPLGLEGAGRVVALGAGTGGPPVGTLVIAPGAPGFWCDRRNLPATAVVPVPARLPPSLAASFAINPPTAWRMLHDFVSLQPGDWVVCNAANSGVGRLVCHYGRAMGWRVLAVVRRPELADELLACGASAVLADTPDWHRQVGRLTGKAPMRLGLNAVGGASGDYLARCLAPGATLVTYGAMSREPLILPNGPLIFGDLIARGFWVTRWFEQATAAARDAMFEALWRLPLPGPLAMPIAATYPLADYAQALALAAQSQRAGKVLLCP